MTVCSSLRLGLAAGLTCLFSVFTPLHADVHAAAATIDQQQPIYDGALSVRQGTSQTFTAGRSGTLTEVDIVLCTEGNGNQVTLEVRPAITPLVATHKLNVLTLTKNTYKCTWHLFKLGAPLTVTTGESMTIVVTRVKGFAPLWAYDARRGVDPYVGGVGSWQGHPINDFAFRDWIAA